MRDLVCLQGLCFGKTVRHRHHLFLLCKIFNLVNDDLVSAEGQWRCEAQAAVKALGSVLGGFMRRNVLLELDVVVRDESALGAAELHF